MYLKHYKGYRISQPLDELLTYNLPSTRSFEATKQSVQCARKRSLHGIGAATPVQTEKADDQDQSVPRIYYRTTAEFLDREKALKWL